MRNFEFKPETEAALIHATKLMGFESLWPEQDQAIRADIAGKQTLVLLPTSGGKTACYVIPGIVKRRQSIVVSPLKALQYSQVQDLKERGILAYTYNSDMSAEEKEQVAIQLLAARKQSVPSFLYVAPESLLMESFFRNFGAWHFHTMAIDEVHCVSTWGNSFRPDYMRIKAAAERLKIEHCSGFTATTTPGIRSDIFRYTPLKEKECMIINGKFVRENLVINVIRTDEYKGSTKIQGNKKRLAILKTLKKQPGAAILYGSSVRACEKLYENIGFRGRVNRMGYSSYLFHAGLLEETKDVSLRGLLNDNQPAVISTNALGMGMDRSDVRKIIHFTNPSSLLGFAQEIGRAGRDGLPAICTTFFNPALIDHSIISRKFRAPSLQSIENVQESIVKSYQKRSLKAKRSFSTTKYIRQLEKVMADDDDNRGKDIYLDRVRAAISLLKQVGYIREDDGGIIRFFKIKPGSNPHKEMVDLSEMIHRTQTEQIRAVEEFFTDKNPTQMKLKALLG